MKVRTLLLTVIVIGALAPLPAHAKGADKATIEGDGMGSPIVFKSRGGDGAEPGGMSRLSRITDGSGIFPALFPSYPNPITANAPEGELGPMLTIEWHFPAGNESFTVTQDLYPYAEAGPLTYTAPGQPLFDDSESAGGWFQSPRSFLPMLKRHGLPSASVLGAAAPSSAGSAAAGSAASEASNSPAPSTPDPSYWPYVIFGGLVLLVAGALLVARRRTPTVTAG